MTRIMLAAGVAALAIAAPAASAPGGKGGHGHAAAQQQQRGGGHAQEARAGKAKANRVATRTQRAERPQKARSTRMATAQAKHSNRAQARERVAAHAPARGKAQAEQRVARRDDGAKARIEQRSAARSQALARAERQKLGRNANPVLADRDRNVVRVRDANGVIRTRVAENARGYGVGGCPPGLEKKPVRCMPPGQAAKLAPLSVAARKNAAAAAVLDPVFAREFVGRPVRVVRERIALEPIPVRLRSIYRDTPDYYYQYGDGYVYRVNRTSNLISSLLPLFGLGYGIGQPFPSAYSNYYLPTAYQPFYPTTPYANYRYANGYVYEINPFTGMIEDVDPLLGYGYGYGQMMPATYSAYNVPYQYRPLYYDTSDYYYRYAPGAIYQVDPTTSLITAVAALLTGGLNIGQPLPAGYSAYNVPLSYRAQYYDTPNAWYRYADGYIYRVDPVTGLVTQRVVTVV